MQTTANSTYTVLVADDDIALNHLWRDALSDAGFNVLTSSNGLKALDTIRYGSKVDVILLDYSMPTLDGSRTLGHLKDQFPNVKAIGVTGVDTSQIPDTYRNGVEKLLPKPVKISDLVDAIHSVLGVPVGAETETEPAKRKIDWTRFALWSTFDVTCCYVILRMLYRAVSQVLLSR
jgi:two-component system, CitB family, response regulator DctR